MQSDLFHILSISEPDFGLKQNPAPQRVNVFSSRQVYHVHRHFDYDTFLLTRQVSCDITRSRPPFNDCPRWTQVVRHIRMKTRNRRIVVADDSRPTAGERDPVNRLTVVWDILRERSVFVWIHSVRNLRPNGFNCKDDRARRRAPRAAALPVVSAS